MLGFFAVVCLLLTSICLILGLEKRKPPFEKILLFFLFSFTQIVLIGFVLSRYKVLNKVEFWLIAECFFLVFSLILVFLNKKKESETESLGFSLNQKLEMFKKLTKKIKILIVILVGSLALLGAMNLSVIVTTAPFNWDSMTCHLARMAYYLQQGSFDFFQTDYWQQILHPTNSTTLFLYSFLMSGKNERATQIVQFACYWLTIVAIYGISYEATKNKIAGFISACIFGLLIECLMESTTTQNDMIITACSAIATYFTVTYFKDFDWKRVAYVGLAMGLAIGIKYSAIIILPCLAMLIVYFIIENKQFYFKYVFLFLISCALGIFFLSLPAGYYKSYREFGSFFGPKEYIQDYVYYDTSFKARVVGGLRNTIRYSLDFLVFDGLPETGFGKINNVVRTASVKFFARMGLDLTKNSNSVFAFEEKRLPSRDENFAYWGILGPGLVLLSVFVVLFIRGAPQLSKVMAGAFILFFICQAFVGPYDQWRGRYFIAGSIFALPALAGWIALKMNSKWFLRYLVIAVAIGSLVAFSAVIFRHNNKLITFTFKNNLQRSVFSLNRIEQLTRENNQYECFKEYEEIVPRNACVALCLPRDSYEYPFFGEKLTRKIIPINSVFQGILPTPQEAQYMVFERHLIHPDSKDVDLFRNTWYLRRLK